MEGRNWWLGVLLLGACAAEPRVPAADLVLRGGRVVTVDSGVPAAQAVAVSGSRIVAVGSGRVSR